MDVRTSDRWRVNRVCKGTRPVCVPQVCGSWSRLPPCSSSVWLPATTAQQHFEHAFAEAIVLLPLLMMMLTMLHCLRLPGEGLGEQVQRRLGGLLTGLSGEPSTLS